LDIKQIKDSLNKIFKEENKRIIFWYDAEREFEQTIPFLEMDDVNILRLNEIARPGNIYFMLLTLSQYLKMTGFMISGFTVIHSMQIKLL